MKKVIFFFFLPIFIIAGEFSFDEKIEQLLKATDPEFIEKNRPIVESEIKGLKNTFKSIKNLREEYKDIFNNKIVRPELFNKFDRIDVVGNDVKNVIYTNMFFGKYFFRLEENNEIKDFLDSLKNIKNFPKDLKAKNKKEFENTTRLFTSLLFWEKTLFNLVLNNFSLDYPLKKDSKVTQTNLIFFKLIAKLFRFTEAMEIKDSVFELFIIRLSLSILVDEKCGKEYEEIMNNVRNRAKKYNPFILYNMPFISSHKIYAAKYAIDLKEMIAKNLNEEEIDRILIGYYKFILITADLFLKESVNKEGFNIEDNKIKHYLGDKMYQSLIDIELEKNKPIEEKPELITCEDQISIINDSIYGKKNITKKKLIIDHMNKNFDKFSNIKLINLEYIQEDGQNKKEILAAFIEYLISSGFDNNNNILKNLVIIKENLQNNNKKNNEKTIIKKEIKDDENKMINKIVVNQSEIIKKSESENIDNNIKINFDQELINNWIIHNKNLLINSIKKYKKYSDKIILDINFFINIKTQNNFIDVNKDDLWDKFNEKYALALHYFNNLYYLGLKNGWSLKNNEISYIKINALNPFIEKEEEPKENNLYMLEELLNIMSSLNEYEKAPFGTQRNIFIMDRYWQDALIFIKDAGFIKEYEEIVILKEKLIKKLERMWVLEKNAAFLLLCIHDIIGSTTIHEYGSNTENLCFCKYCLKIIEDYLVSAKEY